MILPGTLTAHVLPVNRVSVSFKEERLYVVTAVPVDAIIRVDGLPISEATDQLRRWFMEALRWDGIDASSYLDVRVEFDAMHSNRLFATCYAVIDVPHSLNTLTFRPKFWFTRTPYLSESILKYSVVLDSGNGPSEREVIELTVDTDKIDTPLRF
jgi:hypothetical protein